MGPSSHRVALRLGVALSLVGALLLAGCQTPTAQPADERTPSHVEAKWPVPAGLKTMAVNGYPMAYKDAGQGATAVFVHGLLSDERLWFLQVDPPPNAPVVPLSRDYRTIAVSLRHHWPEPWNGKGSDYSTTQHATDVIEFIRQIGAPVHLVGWSRGGQIALEVARARPDLIRKLVLAEPDVDYLLPPGDPVIPHLAADARQINDRMSAGDVEGALEAVVDSASGQRTWDHMPEQARQTLRDNAATLQPSINEKPQPAGCRELAAVRMPVLLVISEGATARFSRDAAELAKCLPQAERVVIEKAAHNMQVTNPIAFNEAVARFLGK